MDTKRKRRETCTLTFLILNGVLRKIVIFEINWVKGVFFSAVLLGNVSARPSPSRNLGPRARCAGALANEHFVSLTAVLVP